MNMDFAVVCRTCLGGKNLNPIFSNPDDTRRYSTAVLVTAGIKITPNDGLPQNMCMSCMYSLNNCLKFRKTCKDTERKLLLMKSDSEKFEMDSNVSTTDAVADKNGVKREKTEERVIIDPGAVSDEEDVKAEYIPPEDGDDDKPLKYLIVAQSDDDDKNADDAIMSNEDAVKTDTAEDLSETHTSKSNRVTCDLCQKNLSVRSLPSHMARSHPGADDRRVKCDLCDRYILRERVSRHRSMVHGDGALRCGYCKTEFENKEKLIDHVTTCTAKRKKRKVCESRKELLECDECHKMMQKASLRMHKAIKHAGLGPVCEHCGRRFGNKFRLNEHYRAKHGYDKFKCSYCDFQSAGAMAMRNHERRHRGEKPFVCEACGAKFHAAYLLAQHRQSHRTEKLVKCDLCPARFKANNSLHMHKLTCHSSALYRCTMCARAYSCRHYAVKHLRHVHDYRGPVPPLQKISADTALAS